MLIRKRHKVLTVFAVLLFPVDLMAQNEPDSVALKPNAYQGAAVDEMRSFETDRPDVTESPYTVPKGHFQLETDLIKSTRCKTANLKQISNSYHFGNYKIGISESIDLQFVMEAIITEFFSDPVIPRSVFGPNCLTFRLKKNLWGNDAGKTAFALLPFVNIPFSVNRKISGGITFPFARALKNDWGFGVQLESDIDENENTDGYHLKLLLSATVSHPLFENCSFFLENFVTRNFEDEQFAWYNVPQS